MFQQTMDLGRFQFFIPSAFARWTRIYSILRIGFLSSSSDSLPFSRVGGLDFVLVASKDRFGLVLHVASLSLGRIGF